MKSYAAKAHFSRIEIPGESVTAYHRSLLTLRRGSQSARRDGADRHKRRTIAQTAYGSYHSRVDVSEGYGGVCKCKGTALMHFLRGAHKSAERGPRQSRSHADSLGTKFAKF